MRHPIEANMTTPREDKVALTSPAGIAWFMSVMQHSELIQRKGGKWVVVAAHPYESWTLFTLREILMVSTPQPKTEATPMKDQMQYIVIEGRKPQDGAKPTQALLILPKWISPTLACAGIVGRIIELTDGNVIEQGALPLGEQELLDEIREDAARDSESQQESVEDFAASRAEAMEPILSLDTPSNWPSPAYREGMQATRDKLAGLLLQFGMPTDAKVPNWLKEQLEELAQFRKDRPETLAKLQAAEDNLDAWRDAADVADLIQVCDTQTGRITALLVQGVAVEQLAVAVDASEKSEESLSRSKALLLANNRYYNLQRAVAEVMLAGQDYIDKGGLAE